MTKVIIVIIGALFLVLAILVLLEAIPIIAIPLLIPAAGFVFWKKEDYVPMNPGHNQAHHYAVFGGRTLQARVGVRDVDTATKRSP